MSELVIGVEKKLYWQVSIPNGAQNSTETLDGVVAWLESFEDDGEGYVPTMTLTPIWLTEQEYASLPDFTGF